MVYIIPNKGSCHNDNFDQVVIRLSNGEAKFYFIFCFKKSICKLQYFAKRVKQVQFIRLEENIFPFDLLDGRAQSFKYDWK